MEERRGARKERPLSERGFRARYAMCVFVCAPVYSRTRSRRCFVDACLHRRSIKRWRRVEYFDTGRVSILARRRFFSPSARSQHPRARNLHCLHPVLHRPLSPETAASRAYPLRRDAPRDVAPTVITSGRLRYRPRCAIAPRSRDDWRLERVLRIRSGFRYLYDNLTGNSSSGFLDCRMHESRESSSGSAITLVCFDVCIQAIRSSRIFRLCGNGRAFLFGGLVGALNVA